MDTLTSPSLKRVSGSGQRVEFLPPEAALEMSTQALRDFRRARGAADFGPKSIALRRAYIFIGTAALTLGGCYEMYQVLQVGGITTLEAMVLVLFVLLFAWIAFSFMSSLAGFFVLLFRKRDRAGNRSRRAAPAGPNAAMRCCCRPTTRTPIGSWRGCGRSMSWSGKPDTRRSSTGTC